MRRLLLVLLATIGAFSLTGCNFFNRGGTDEVAQDPEPAVQEVPENAPSPAPAENGLPDVPDQAEGGPITSPTVIAPDLIQSTNPSERVGGVQRSRPDPFASLPIPPTPPAPIVVPTAQGQGARTAPPTVSAGGGRAAGATAASRATAGRSASATARPAPTRAGSSTAVVRPSPIVPLPPVPQPNEARAVRVSGVVQVGDTSYAIVQVPNEVERYVSVGQRVANGRVLVKRIDTNSLQPVVVLEQNGIEVERSVVSPTESAEAAPAQEDFLAPQASLPTRFLG